MNMEARVRAILVVKFLLVKISKRTLFVVLIIKPVGSGASESSFVSVVYFILLLLR